MLRSEATLSRQSIDDAIARSLACLRGHFRTSAPEAEGTTEPAGWYHFLDDANPGVTASAVGLYCFSLADAEFERTDQVLDYLISKQIHTPAGGGWPIRTIKGFPIVEATAWVLRCLSLPQTRTGATRAALDAGVAWLEANQNTDFGWGSYKGQPSRTFTTALSVLALRESGGSRAVIADAHKWLIEAQSPGQPAWGALAGASPTMLHTSFALMALLTAPGTLTATAAQQTLDWLATRLEPSQHVEKETAVEEYDVPWINNSAPDTFQNSLPHFAGPVTLTALLRGGADPLHKKIFDTVNGIINSQEADDPGLSGSWELPRSPRRPSIWAVWPFMAALSSARTAVFPPTDSTVMLLSPGCALIQSSASSKHLTRRLLIKNALTDWLRQRWVAVCLWVIAAALVVISVILWKTGQLTLSAFLSTLVAPVLLLLFQIIWDRRSSSKDKHT